MLSLTLISCILCCFMNHEKDKKNALVCKPNNAYKTFLFFLFLMILFYSSHSLRHPSLGLNTSSLTLRQRAQVFLPGRYPFFRALRLGILISLYHVSSFFETQHQLTHPPIKGLNPSYQEYVRFSGHSSGHSIFILSCVGSL